MRLLGLGKRKIDVAKVVDRLSFDTDFRIEMMNSERMPVFPLVRGIVERYEGLGEYFDAHDPRFTGNRGALLMMELAEKDTELKSLMSLVAGATDYAPVSNGSPMVWFNTKTGLFTVNYFTGGDDGELVILDREKIIESYPRYTGDTLRKDIICFAKNSVFSSRNNYGLYGIKDSWREILGTKG